MMSCYFGFLIPEISFIDEVVCSAPMWVYIVKFFPKHLRLHFFWVIFLFLNFQVYDTLIDWRATVIPGTFPIGRCWGGERARRV